ncbi:hypothetical protein ABZV31_23170 [Streptomyces sp. NPDC005202]|uniref:hypothetical protein n=1 Tax=Streptomyces sp. NPDC005202 TaxID=3157021 RepID=UPI00339DB4D5
MGVPEAGQLVTAVRRGDVELVRQLLEGGTDPDTLDETEGVPVLCSPSVPSTGSTRGTRGC